MAIQYAENSKDLEQKALARKKLIEMGQPFNPQALESMVKTPNLLSMLSAQQPAAVAPPALANAVAKPATPIANPVAAPAINPTATNIATSTTNGIPLLSAQNIPANSVGIDNRGSWMMAGKGNQEPEPKSFTNDISYLSENAKLINPKDGDQYVNPNDLFSNAAQFDVRQGLQRVAAGMKGNHAGTVSAVSSEDLNKGLDARIARNQEILSRGASLPALMPSYQQSQEPPEYIKRLISLASNEDNKTSNPEGYRAWKGANNILSEILGYDTSAKGRDLSARGQDIGAEENANQLNQRDREFSGNQANDLLKTQVQSLNDYQKNQIAMQNVDVLQKRENRANAQLPKQQTPKVETITDAQGNQVSAVYNPETKSFEPVKIGEQAATQDKKSELEAIINDSSKTDAERTEAIRLYKKFFGA